LGRIEILLDNLQYDEARAQLNTKFRLTETTELIELELIEVTPQVITPAQEMFSLIFRGAKEFVLEQRTYQLRHESLGEGAIFLAPISQDKEGILYEAAFNRLIKSN
jgi:hypothetical protein